MSTMDKYKPAPDGLSNVDLCQVVQSLHERGLLRNYPGFPEAWRQLEDARKGLSGGDEYDAVIGPLLSKVLDLAATWMNDPKHTRHVADAIETVKKQNRGAQWPFN